jgi:hypothetical protein
MPRRNDDRRKKWRHDNHDRRHDKGLESLKAG